MRHARKLLILPLAASLLCLASCKNGEDDPGTIEQVTAADTSHVPVGTTVTYASNPPAIGQHWPTVQPHGEELVQIRAEMYVHALEHGAIVFLYDCPVGCADTAQQLRTYAQTRAPSGDGRAFQWVLSPYAGMPTEVSVLAWGWIYRSERVDLDEIESFVSAHYRDAPEDIPLPP